MYTRNITQNLKDALADTPVVLLAGARQTGEIILVRAKQIEVVIAMPDSFCSQVL